MKTINKVLSGLIAVIAIALVQYLMLGVAAPAFSTSTLLAILAQSSTPTPPPERSFCSSRSRGLPRSTQQSSWM
jgi:hypothetical protein